MSCFMKSREGEAGKERTSTVKRTGYKHSSQESQDVSVNGANT